MNISALSTYWQCPSEVRQQFQSLGATRVSIGEYTRTDCYGRERTETVDGLLYFWDNQNREIGYVALYPLLKSEPQTFAPNYRTWSQENLDIQQFAVIPTDTNE